MGSKQRAEEIRTAMKKIISRIVFPAHVREEENEERFWFAGALLSLGYDSLRGTYEVSLDLECVAIQSLVFHRRPVPTDKIQEADELIHALNRELVIGHLFRDSLSNELTFTIGMIIRDLEFHEVDFARVMAILIKKGREVLNFLGKQLQSDEDSNISLQRFLENWSS